MSIEIAVALISIAIFIWFAITLEKIAGETKRSADLLDAILKSEKNRDGGSNRQHGAVQPPPLS